MASDHRKRHIIHTLAETTSEAYILAGGVFWIAWLTRFHFSPPRDPTGVLNNRELFPWVSSVGTTRITSRDWQRKFHMRWRILQSPVVTIINATRNSYRPTVHTFRHSNTHVHITIVQNDHGDWSLAFYMLVITELMLCGWLKKASWPIRHELWKMLAQIIKA